MGVIVQHWDCTQDRFKAWALKIFYIMGLRVSFSSYIASHFCTNECFCTNEVSSALLTLFSFSGSVKKKASAMATQHQSYEQLFFLIVILIIISWHYSSNFFLASHLHKSHSEMLGISYDVIAVTKKMYNSYLWHRYLRNGNLKTAI